MLMRVTCIGVDIPEHNASKNNCGVASRHEASALNRAFEIAVPEWLHLTMLLRVRGADLAQGGRETSQHRSPRAISKRK